MNAAEWFDRWLEGHKRRNPHKEFQVYEQGGREIVYAGWIRAFDRRGITPTIAIMASVEMQAEGIAYPEHHLPRLLKHAGRIAIEQQHERREQRRAIEAARDAEQEAALRKAKALWASQTESFREEHRERVRREFPKLARLTAWVENVARTQWIEGVRESRGRKPAMG